MTNRDPFADALGLSVAQGRANVRKRIVEELRIDDSRSDREIGRVVGADHKTVARIRKARGWETPPAVAPPPGRLIGDTFLPDP